MAGKIVVSEILSDATSSNTVKIGTGMTLDLNAQGTTVLPAGSLVGSLPALDGSALTSLTSGNLSGALPAISGASLTNLPAGGITEADHWRLTADITTNTDITSNLERVDDSAFSVLGTGMTQSSGVFTFPSTGYWLVTAKFAMHVGSIDNVSLTTFYTIDTGSNWIKLTSAHNSNHSSGQLRDTTGTVDGIFDVTNTSTHKVKFTTGSVGSATVIMGHTDHTLTGFMFIKLGDT